MNKPFFEVLGFVTAMALTSGAIADALTLNAVGRGRIDEDIQRTGRSVTNNYIVGFLPAEPDVPPADPDVFIPEVVYHNWFAFDLSAVADEIVSAELLINVAIYDSPDATETYELHHVATAPGVIGTMDSVAHFHDLGDGPVYGSRVFSELDESMVRSVVLNGNAVADLNRAIGGLFELGGKLSTLSGQTSDSEFIFAASQGSSVTRLRLEVVPEPTTSALALAGLLFAFGRRRTC